MAESGVRVVCATPHVRDDFPTSPGSMERALALVQAAVEEAGIAIEVRGGAEIALNRLPRLDSGVRERFGLGGNPGLLLLETPYATWPTDLPRVCTRLREDGIVPVVAHPERNPHVQNEPTLLDDVVAAGGVVQVTAASFDGSLGRATARCAHRLLELELVHLIASDAHAPRGAGVRDGRGRRGGGWGRARRVAVGRRAGCAARGERSCRRGLLRPESLDRGTQIQTPRRGVVIDERRRTVRTSKRRASAGRRSGDIDAARAPFRWELQYRSDGHRHAVERALGQEAAGAFCCSCCTFVVVAASVVRERPRPARPHQSAGVVPDSLRDKAKAHPNDTFHVVIQATDGSQLEALGAWCARRKRSIPARRRA